VLAHLCGRETVVAVLRLVGFAFLAGVGLLIVFALFDRVLTYLVVAAAIAALVVVVAGWRQVRKANRQAEQFP
jgi:Flp pilus assembly protein TadB